MELHFHIPHVPFKPPKIYITLKIISDFSIISGHPTINPATKLFTNDYPWEYQNLTVADITNKYASIPIPQFEPFNVFFLRVVHAVCPVKTDEQNQWTKIEGCWMFRGCLKVYRYWHYEEDYIL